LENKFDLLASQFEKFCARFDENTPLKKKVTGKGKGRGKKSKQTTSDPGVQSVSEAEINAEAQRRLEIFLRENQVRTQSTSEPVPGTSRSMTNLRQSGPTVPEPPTHSTRSFQSCARSFNNDDLMTDDLSVVNDDDTKEIYIKRIECTLNQNPLDQVEDNQRNTLTQKFEIKL
jgi:hypothetical protein